jgi:hypothetical protein
MPKFSKKPVVIEAFQWEGDNWQEVYDWIMSWDLQDPGVSCLYEKVTIQTLEGEMTASIGDFIIRGVQGEFYPCKPDIFDLTYEPVND